MDVSVVIPTFNRAEKLARCVHALACQSIGTGRYEVLVGTDGADGEAAEAALQAWRSGGGPAGGLSVLECPKAGPGPTRNRLIERARGGVLLLLNDDVVPAEALVEEHARAHRALESGRAMVLGAAPWKVHTPDRLFDRLIRETSMVFFYDQMTGARAADPTHDWGFRHAWTLNLSVPMSGVRDAGGFNESLACACFEDLEFGWRLSKIGLPVLFRPRAVVVHDHRYEPAGYLEREELLGGEAYRLARAAPACAQDVFGRDVSSAGELAYCREFVERERTSAARLERSFLALAEMPADAVTGGHAGTLVQMLYQQHLLLKRWRWRNGLLAAAQAS